MNPKYEGLMRTNKMVRDSLLRLRKRFVENEPKSIDDLHDMMDFMIVDSALNVFMKAIEDTAKSDIDGELLKQELTEDERATFNDLMKSFYSDMNKGGDVDA